MASRHGATAGIADVIAHELTADALSAEVIPVEDVASLEEYDAVILGSAIYYGRWLKSAVDFADLFVQELSERPLWLFSSGPVERASGHTSPDADSDTSPITGLLQPRSHKVFPGALDKTQLSFAERAVTHVVRADYGDFRDWDDVRSWAHSITAVLTGQDTDVG